MKPSGFSQTILSFGIRITEETAPPYLSWALKILKLQHSMSTHLLKLAGHEFKPYI